MKHFFSLMRGWLVALLILLGLAGTTARAQAPAWQTATVLSSNSTSGNRGVSTVRATAAASNGDLYLVGDFLTQAVFGTTVLNAGSSQGLFVAKWSGSLNAFVWVQQVGGGTNADLTAAAIAVSGTSIYIAGTAVGATVNFGSISMNSSGGSDAFVAKLVDTGTTADFAWVQHSTGTGDEHGTGLALNGTTAYLTGTFGGSGVAGTAAFGSTTFTAAGVNTTDIFVTKLTDAGTSAAFGWALQVGSSSNDLPHALVANGPNVYLGGYATGPVAFGSITTATTVNHQSGFVAKLVDAGATAAFAWVQVPTGQTEVFALAVNGSTVYAAGEFNYAPSFGSVRLNTTGLLDGFVVKLADAGTTSSFVWGHSFGTVGYDGAHALAVSGRELFVAGYAYGDLYLGHLTDAGTAYIVGWTQRPYAPTDNDYAEAVAVAPGSRVYISGAASPTISFGSFNFNYLYSNRSIGFLASLTDPTLTATTAAQSSFSFSLYPNPARAATTVQLPALPGTTTATLTLSDALGRAVRTATVALPAAGLRHEFDLTSLPAGVYALQVQAGAATATRKLVVE